MIFKDVFVNPTKKIAFLRGKCETTQTSKNMSRSRLPRRVTRTLDKEGFWEDPRQAEIQHAFAHPSDGRADSMCCAQTAARGSSYAACSHA